jgi:hypothetical protein
MDRRVEGKESNKRTVECDEMNEMRETEEKQRICTVLVNI